MLSLSRDEFNKLLQIVLVLNAILFIPIWLLRIRAGTAPWPAAGQSISLSIGLSTALLHFGLNRVWKWPVLAWLANRPIVHGVWWGEIRPIYQGRAIEPIPIAFVIRQKYASLSIQSFTSNIPADSTIEVFERSAKSTDVYLKYVYHMTREANAENKSTVGYGRLRLERAGQVLDGSYWTNSPTSGQIRLNLVTRECDDINCFESAREAADKKGFVVKQEQA
ncbi:hypothetical protein [Stenotrophomonas sp.]|uniref:hypothetical protein n=1 Tax=Stenotrophomonas sp. TaxID=69392 RepID=UPI0028A8A4C8|nr:hypothetical protein [Stenotrophomonas sp.]